MNTDVAIAKQDGWAVDRYLPGARAAAAAEQAADASRFDVANLLRVLLEWRWLILAAAGLGLVAGLVSVLLTTPLYRAWVTMEVNPPSVEIMDEKRREPSAEGYDFLATQVGLLSSRSLAERVAQELNLAANPAVAGTEGDPATRLKIATAAVAGGLHVVMPEEGQLIRFSYDSPSPQLAAQVANGVADMFIDSNLQRKYQATSYARKFLERQIAKARADLERSERQLVAYAQAQGIINTASGKDEQGGESSLQAASLNSLNEALAEATTKRVAAEAAYRQARATGTTEQSNLSTQSLRQSKAALEAEYQEKRTLMKPDHPEMVSLRSRIDELDRQIGKETSQVASGRANTLLAEFRAAQSAEQTLRSRVAQLKGDVLDLRGRSIQYTILQREVDTNRSLYDALLQRYKEVGVASGIGAAPVSIVDRAEPPGGPFKPNLPVSLAMGLGLGLVGGLGAAFGIDYLNDTIKTRRDVRSKLGLACLGVIPKKLGKGSFVEDLRDPASAVSEAYSSVVAALRFSTDSGTPKSLLVTSTRPGEGKSSSALALAQNFARMGQSVLLIDADLRKPAFKTALEHVGLSPLLTSSDSVASQVVKTQYDNLWLLPAGPLPPNPADLLASGRFDQILQEATKHFDVVVVDGPPVLGLADAALLAVSVGAVMFVVESSKTRTGAAADALERLRGSGAHVIGATLNKAGDDGTGYGYGYGYGYGQGAMGSRRAEILMIPHEPES